MAQGPGNSITRPGEEVLFWPQVFSALPAQPAAQEIEVLGVLSPACSRYHCSHVSQAEVSVACYRIRLRWL